MKKYFELARLVAVTANVVIALEKAFLLVIQIIDKVANCARLPPRYAK